MSPETYWSPDLKRVATPSRRPESTASSSGEFARCEGTRLRLPAAACRNEPTRRQRAFSRGITRTHQPNNAGAPVMRNWTIAAVILGTLLSGCIGFGFSGGGRGGGQYYHHRDWR